jgi:hypothetical protein
VRISGRVSVSAFRRAREAGNRVDGKFGLRAIRRRGVVVEPVVVIRPKYLKDRSIAARRERRAVARMP